MTSKSQKFIVRKEKILFKEFDLGFSTYQKLVSKIANIHQWTVTINIGLILYVFTYSINLFYVLITVGIYMSTFFLLELRERSSMKFDKDNILLLEDLFNEKNKKKYKRKVKEYEFKEKRLQLIPIGKKMTDYFDSIKSLEVFAWYSMWSFIWIVIITLKIINLSTHSFSVTDILIFLFNPKWNNIII